MISMNTDPSDPVAGNGRVCRPETDIGSGHAHSGQPGADLVLPGDERGAPGGAALLTVIVCKGRALIADAIDVGDPIAHLAAAVVADVPPADVVTPEDENVRLASVCACRIEHNLVVLPKLLDKSVGLLITSRSRAPQDLIDRAAAVDCGQYSLLRHIDREGEVGIGVGPVDEDRRKTGRRPVANAQSPR